ncbi:MAG: protein kinase, partial [candidate division KSB1 bacterium]
LGEGGMGVVYKAEDTKLERIVAIKFLPHHIAANADERARFKIEAKAAAALNHPNIATIYAIEEVDGEMFIVMEFIEGRELKEFSIANFQLKIENCLSYATQIAEGLKAAHAKGITHRDIKSSNIMVTESGQVKIMDFGLAKMGGDVHLTKTGTTLGTEAYMSPEQARGEVVDQRTDIWSFGVVLYEMLTGQLPFRGVYEQAVIYSILNEDPQTISSLRPEVPRALEANAHKALAKKAEERYQHMEEVLAALKSSTTAAAPEVVKAIKPNLPKRSRALVYGGIAALLIVLTAVVLYFIPQPAASIDAIAVLPLTNLSGDPNQEYFADGMTEALISVLGQIEALRVISRTSVMQYKGGTKPLPAIGRELNVDAVVEGSVQSSGNRVNISVRLIVAETEKGLWSKNFEREPRDVLTLQREVGLAIAQEIKVQITPNEQARLEKARTVNPKAYELYLWGRNFRDKETPESLKQAVDCFEQAIVIDPGFAPAYASLVVPYQLFGALNLLPAEEANSKARQAAAKALHLDETLSETHGAIAVFREMVDWDWSGAEQSFKRAIELNPNNAEAHREYGLFLGRMRRTDEGLAEMKRAHELDPLSEQVNAYLAWAYIFNRQYDEAIAHCQTALQLNPGFALVRFHLGIAYLTKGLYKESVAVFETHAVAGLGRLEALGYLGSAYALSGQKEKALQLLAELKMRLKQGQEGSSVGMAQIYVSLGEKDEALAMLERAYEQRSVWFVHLMRNPVFDPVRAEPRFQALLKKMGLER